MEVEEIEDRLTKIVRLIVDSPDAAKHGLLTTTAANKLSIADLHVVVGKADRQSVMFAVVRENREMREQLRRTVRGRTWEDFVAACGERIDTTRRQWRPFVAGHLGLSVGDLSNFERANRVPMAVFKQLDELPDLRTKASASSMYYALPLLVGRLSDSGLADEKITDLLAELVAHHGGDDVALRYTIRGYLDSDETRVSAYTWTPEAYQQALAMLFDDVSGPQVAERLGLKEGQIWSKFTNRAPDETLLPEPIVVQTEGPMSFLELWKIGHALYGTGWRAEIEKRFQLGGRKIRFKQPEHVLSEPQIQTLREDYGRLPQPRKARYRLNAKAQFILDAIRRAGPEGMTQDEMEKLIDPPSVVRFRRHDLILHRLIFDSQRLGGPFNRAIIWVAAEYREHYPEAWAAAQNNIISNE